VDSSGANAIAMFNLTRHGQAASNFVNPSRAQRQVQFLPFANVVVEEYGTNDLGSAGGGVPSTILANVEKIWTLARNAGVQKIIRTQLMPRTSSTDSWATLANQTPNSGWETGGKRDTINAGFQTALANRKIDILLDTLAVVGDPTDRNRWRTNGTAKYVNVDDAHVSPAGNALLAPHLRAALLSLTVDPAPPGYAAWSAATAWGGADSSAGADPNADGISNLLAYALDVSPINPVAPGDRPSAIQDTATPDGPWLALTYRQKSTATDLIYQVQSSPDLGAWSALVIDGVNAVAEVVNPDPDGDGSAVLRRVRVKQTAGGALRFLRLNVVK
jgi:lysophospholipase L1-like esterase